MITMTDNDDRATADALVNEETRGYRPTKNYLDHLPVLNWSNFEI